MSLWYAIVAGNSIADARSMRNVWLLQDGIITTAAGGGDGAVAAHASSVSKRCCGDVAGNICAC
jgi:hypothetical protein